MKGFRSITSALVLGVVLFTGFSCEMINGNQTKPDGPLTVSADIVWSQDSGSTDLQPMLIRDGVLYYAERGVNGFTARNPENGEILWQDVDRGISLRLPIFFENGRIGYIGYIYVYLYNPDGSFYRLIKAVNEDYTCAGDGAAYGNTIIYPTKVYGMVYFDVETDVELVNGEYVVTPNQLYENPPDEDHDNDIRWIAPLVRNGILYSGVHPVWRNPGTFFAIDLAQKSVLWETNPSGLDAWSDFPMSYVDGRLIVLDPVGFGIIDAESGKILVERGIYYGGGYEAGGYFYEGKVYYTNGSTADNPDTPNNVICMDVSTGDPVWLQSFEGSHGSNPVCYQGITYVFSQDCMRVLDAQTGQQLGIDRSIRGDIWQIANIVTYKDLAIVKYMGRIYAVRMNFRTDGKGNLWKE